MKALSIFPFLLLFGQIIAQNYGRDKDCEQNGKLKVWLPAGTPVSLKLNQEVNGQEVEIGTTVEFVVKIDVVLKGKKLIATNTYAEGSVIESIKSCETCKPKNRGCGKIIIRVETVQAVDGQRIHLQGDPMTITGNCCCGGGPAVAKPERTYRSNVLNNVQIQILH